MSSGLKVQLSDLRIRLDRVVAEVQDIADELAELQSEGAFGDWVLVEEERPPLDLRILQPIWAANRFVGPEDGPPSTPQCCLDLAHQQLIPATGSAVEVEVRAHQAFCAGFWCKLAVDSKTHYRRSEDIDFDQLTHWIVLDENPNLCRRGTRSRCLSVALEVAPNGKWEGFASFVELCIFCAGARVNLPKLELWTSLF